MRHLTVNYATQLLELRIGRAKLLKRLHGVANRREWIPEFVRERRQELVLEAIRLLDCFFSQLPFRDVTGDLGRPDDLSACIPYRRDGNGDLDPAPVFPHPLGFEMVDSLPLAEFLQDLILIRREFGRDNEQDGIPDRL